jgi:hypothetical protein
MRPGTCVSGGARESARRGHELGTVAAALRGVSDPRIGPDER